MSNFYPALNIGKSTIFSYYPKIYIAPKPGEELVDPKKRLEPVCINKCKWWTTEYLVRKWYEGSPSVSVCVWTVFVALSLFVASCHSLTSTLWFHSTSLRCLLFRCNVFIVAVCLRIFSCTHRRPALIAIEFSPTRLVIVSLSMLVSAIAWIDV